MKSLELQPTYENLFETFIGDTIGRSKDIVSFADILNSIDESCSIALDARWGAGKTFFIKQTKMVLDAFNKFVPSYNEDDNESIRNYCDRIHKKNPMEYIPQVAVYYDAWANDNDEDPVLSLVLSILENVNSYFSFKQGTDIFTKAAAVLEFFTGKSFIDLVNAFKSDNPLEEIQKSKEIETLIKEFLESIFLERGDRLVIFVDELDRCKPDYAVRLLERIKHYFSNDKITFVFSINSLELQHTIKKYYGENFDASRYLDRFFDLRMSLSVADISSFYYSVAFDEKRYTYDFVCNTVINKFNFTIREMAKYIRLTKMAAYKPTHESANNFCFPEGKALQFCLFYIVPIIIGLKICDVSKYDDFIFGRDSSTLVDMIGNYESDWFRILLTSNETFDSNDSERTLVTVEDKLKQVYNAIFVTKYDHSHYQTIIGNCSFQNGLKERLINISGLMSEFTDINGNSQNGV